MSSSNARSLLDLNRVVIGVGLPILIAGILGGTLNIIVFLSLKTFRQSSCAFFLTVMSFVNIGQLITSLRNRIAIYGLNIDWSESSLFFCKARGYALQVFTLISYTCMCLATVDQCLATSLRPRWQKCLTIRRAYHICASVSLMWLLHSIPCIIWYSLVRSSTTSSVVCRITNPAFQVYVNDVYVLVLSGILPLVITVIFASLAYRHVRQIPYRTIPLVRRELDKQLTSMVLVQVMHNVLVILPHLTLLIALNFMSASIRESMELNTNLLSMTTNLVYYLYYAVSRHCSSITPL